MNEVDSARREVKPPRESGVMLASVPMTIIASARPPRKSDKDRPMAWALEEHAVETVRLGPFAPCASATRPDEELSVMVGMKFGCTRSGRWLS